MLSSWDMKLENQVLALRFPRLLGFGEILFCPFQPIKDFEHSDDLLRVKFRDFEGEVELCASLPASENLFSSRRISDRLITTLHPLAVFTAYRVLAALRRLAMSSYWRSSTRLRVSPHRAGKLLRVLTQRPPQCHAKGRRPRNIGEVSWASPSVFEEHLSLQRPGMELDNRQPCPPCPYLPGSVQPRQDYRPCLEDFCTEHSPQDTPTNVCIPLVTVRGSSSAQSLGKLLTKFHALSLADP